MGVEAAEQTPTEPTASSLVRPLSELDILVRGERIFYARRKHWMSIAPVTYETFSTLVIIFLLFVGLPLGGVVGLVVVLASSVSVINMVRRRNWKGLPGFLLVGGLIVGFIILGVSGMALLAAFVSFQRFAIAVARWGYYERLYITNRRIVESSGFLGSQISTLPLSRATDISFSRTVPGEVFGYATFRIETAGQDQALGTIPFLDDPDLFYELLILLSTTETGGLTR